MLPKAAFIVGAATFCCVQLVCTSPAVARGKRLVENTSDEDLTELESAFGQFVYLIVMASLVTCETVAAAGNSHCDPATLPSSLESDKRNHVVANSLRELLQDLRTMEPTQKVYKRMFELAVTPRANASADMWFEALDKAMAAEPRLTLRYDELKSKYEKLVVLEPDHLVKEKQLSSDEHQKAFKKLKPIQELLVNSVFVNALNDTDTEDESDKNIVAKKLKFQALAKTLVEMSESVDKYQKLQPIYNESIAEVATAAVDSDKFETKDAASMLYRKLKQKIKADPLLSAEFREKRNEILKKLKEKA